MLLTVKFRGHEFVVERFKLIHSKIAPAHKTLPPTTTELMKFFGSMIFYFKFTDTFHVNVKPLYDLLPVCESEDSELNNTLTFSSEKVTHSY